MKKSVFWLLLIGLTACTSQQISQTVGILTESSRPLTSNEVGSGLKEALIQGISNGVVQASALDGFLGNSQLRIPFPPDAQRAENALRSIGLGNEVDRFITQLNRGAEQAAAEARPIFVNAIRAMTIEDAFSILRGDANAATNYLRRTTEDALVQAFKPVMENSLNQVNATRFYGELITRYNRIPLVQPVNADLPDYATQKAIDGLFLLVEQEEAKIRQDPAARATDLLKRVFAAQD